MSQYSIYVVPEEFQAVKKKTAWQRSAAKAKKVSRTDSQLELVSVRETCE